MLFLPISHHRDCRYYDRGDVLTEGSPPPTEASPDDDLTPDWRVASFSVTLPLPNACLSGPSPTMLDSLGAPWLRGRYEGLTRATFPRHDQATSNGPPFMHSIHNGATRRFRRTVSRAVGVLGGESVSAGADPNAGDVEQQTVARHLLLDSTQASTSFRIVEEGGAGDARILLRAVEILEFEDPGADHEGVLRHRFLVLHVMAVDCTSATLALISQAMARPRNVVPVHRPPEVPPFDHRPQYADDLKPLKYFAEHAIELLQKDLDPSFRVDAKVEAGGYISAGSASRARADEGLIPRPTRVVMAIPGREVTRGPSILSGGQRGAEDCWTHAQQWAWALATGVDQYAETLPRETPEHADRAMCGAYRRWTVWAEPFGLAIVRHHVRLDEDARRIGQTTLMQLAQTRYVDLAVLTMRQFAILGHLTARLASIETTAPDPDDEGTDGTLARLRDRLRQLEDVQSGMVRFRESLWFRNIPHHEIDTLVLGKMREASGVQRLHDDFYEDLAFRQEVYRTQYTAAELERSRAADARHRARQEERDADREAAQRAEKEEEHQREAAIRAQEAHNERLTQILAVVALALTVPTLIESFGFWATPPAGWMTLGITAAVAVIGHVIVSAFSRRRTRDREEFRRTNQTSDVGPTA